jgi:hypothetical protein
VDRLPVLATRLTQWEKSKPTSNSASASASASATAIKASPEGGTDPPF